MAEYHPTIGLEVHAELKTLTKLFCNSRNDSSEIRPNVNICPVCMGYPGTLPVLNKEAVRHILRVGLAVGGNLADYTEFDRKNYFYPDIPKGYQISQYKFPLISGGLLRGVAIERIHLEEDTAKSLHDRGTTSRIDFNRAGVPLMELVTKPVITSAQEAALFGKELQLLLRTLGAGDANLEKGEMRVEVNISVSRGDVLGTKVEIKNINSFKAVERAIEYEIKRQSAFIEEGGIVVQETRGWDEAKQETYSQRLKESSHDYRYFPDPDVPKLVRSEISEFSDGVLSKSLPELPWEKRARFISLGLKSDDVEMFMSDKELGDRFDESIKGYDLDDPKILVSANLIANDLAKIKGEGKTIVITTEQFRMIPFMITDSTTTTRAARDILAISSVTGSNPYTILKEQGLANRSDKEELRGVVREVIQEQEKAVAEYKSGKTASLQFLVGQGMKKTKGAGNPNVLRELFVEELSL